MPCTLLKEKSPKLGISDRLFLFNCQVNKISATNGSSTSTSAAHGSEILADDDDDELNMDELNVLEASLSKASIQINEQGVNTES